MASNMAKLNDAEAQFYHFLRVAVNAFIRGSAPILAIEFARRTIPADLRPTFQEMEQFCKRTAGAPAPGAVLDAAATPEPATAGKT
jgi:chemotaxis protein MotA